MFLLSTIPNDDEDDQDDDDEDNTIICAINDDVDLIAYPADLHI